ncbi:MAG TPA: hypothetical protein VFV75_11995 [Candidatus Polarisedimenticolaceae bacterium]|nr:hypothetical protein [Candidatus Polarisedimenticolaceae bacterium]
MRLLLPFLLVLGFVPAADAGVRWNRTRSEHFVLVGDARRDVTAVAARELERFRAAVEQVTPLRFGPGPRTGYVFRNARSFRTAAGSVPDVRKLEGLSVAGDSGTVLLALADAPRGGLERIRHELVHGLLDHLDLPLWLGEGLAQYLSFFEPSGDEVTFGLPTLALDRIEDCGWIPLASVVARKAYPTDDAANCAFYLEAALLVQHLAERQEGMAGLFSFVDAVAAGEPAEAALRARYGIEPAAHDTALRAWAEAARAPARAPVPEPAWGRVVVLERLSKVEAWIAAADLALALDDHARAAVGYRRALQGEPSNLAAVSGLGIALAGTEDNAEAIALIEWTQAVDYVREGLDEAYAVALVGRGFERGGLDLREDHRKVRALAQSLDARPRDRIMRAVLLGVASLADPDAGAAAAGRAALEEGVERGVPLSVLAPGLLIFAAREGDDASQARLRAAVPDDRDFEAMTRTVADALRASAWVRSVWDQAERVEALAGDRRRR